MKRSGEKTTKNWHFSKERVRKHNTPSDKTDKIPRQEKKKVNDRVCSSLKMKE